MDIKIKNITVDQQSLTPTLTIAVYIDFYYELEAPISITGRLLTDNKVISYINEYQINNDTKFGLKHLSKLEREKIYQKKNSINAYYTELTAQLSPTAIEHIERTRETKQDKSVYFNCDFLVKHLDMPSIPQEQYKDELVRVNVNRACKDFVIKQSDWVQNYSPLLGIGNFLLLELSIPDKQQVNEVWIELYNRLSLRVAEMNDAIRAGDWQKAIDRGRQFNDNLKFDERKADGHQMFRDEMTKLFEKERHSAIGIQKFFDGIRNFFDYNSKFIHDKDQYGNLNPILTPTREDAYFIYALSMGLLNLIGKKLSNNKN